MSPEIRKSDLTPCQRQLVERIQHLRYGRIENLVVRDGEPVIERGTTKVIRSVSFGEQNDPHPSIEQDGMTLKTKVVHLLEHLKAIGNGVIDVIHVGGGLPAKMEIEDEADDAPGCTVGSGPSPKRPPTRDAAVEISKRR